MLAPISFSIYKNKLSLQNKSVCLNAGQLSAVTKFIAYLMALAEFAKFRESVKYFDVDRAVHVPTALQHNDELSIPVEPVLKVVNVFVLFTKFRVI